MNTNNRLATLLTLAARSFAAHPSNIAQQANSALIRATTLPVTKSAHSVKQCRALQQTYQQHISELNKEIELMENQLHWNDTTATSKAAEIQQHLAYTELIGPAGMIEYNGFRVGLLLQAMNAEYPNHKHAAEELYLVVSGNALWSQSNSTPTLRKPGEFIHHTSWEAHSMKTTSEPLLSLWCWSGDISYESYKMLQ